MDFLDSSLNPFVDCPETVAAVLGCEKLITQQPLVRALLDRGVIFDESDWLDVCDGCIKHFEDKHWTVRLKYKQWDPIDVEFNDESHYTIDGREHLPLCSATKSFFFQRLILAPVPICNKAPHDSRTHVWTVKYATLVSPMALCHMGQTVEYRPDWKH
ncbi:hypothetical protein JCM10212_005123 [Sporobolomyces blumeae]